MCSENDKHNVEPRIFNSLSGSRCQNIIILFAVGMTGSSANRLSKTEPHFRYIIYSSDL